MEDLARTAALFREEPVDVVVTDCMGFTAEMGRIVARESGKQVLVPPAGAAQAHQGAAGAAVRGNSRADFEQAGAL